MTEEKKDAVEDEKNSFLRIFTLIRDNYRSFKRSDQQIIKTYAYIWVVLVAVSIYVFADGPLGFLHTFGKALDGLILALVTSITFALVDRLNILTPVENQLSAGVAKMQSQMDEITKIIKDDSINFKAQSESMHDYEKYIRTRLSFGFHDIRGQKMALAEKDGRGKPPEREDIVKLALASTPDGGTLRYMISFISNAPLFLEHIRPAIARGINIKLMLMMPNEETDIVKARYRDCFGQDIHRTLAHFLNTLKPQAEIIIAERNYHRLKRKLGEGQFDVEFFTQSLNFPLLISTPDDRDSALDRVSYEVAYTGFYAGRNAEDMPYIVWGAGDFKIIDAFKELFDAKWSACSKLQEIDSDRLKATAINE